MSAVLPVIATLLLAAGVVALVQNNRVYRARMGLIERISNAAKADISRGDEWRWRYEAFDAVSYEQMFARPWREPVSLYDSLDFASSRGES